MNMNKNKILTIAIALAVSMSFFLIISCEDNDSDSYSSQNSPEGTQTPNPSPIPTPTIPHEGIEGCYSLLINLDGCWGAGGSYDCETILNIVRTIHGLVQVNLDSERLYGFIEVQSMGFCYRFPYQTTYTGDVIHIELTLEPDEFEGVTVYLSADITIDEQGNMSGTVEFHGWGEALGYNMDCWCNGLLDGNWISHECDFNC